jgi:hypothetical protein
MDYPALKAEIDADPALSGLSDADAAAALNARTVTVRVPTMITKVQVHRTLGLPRGTALLLKFRDRAAASGADDAARVGAALYGEVLDLLRVDGTGLDVSLDETRGFIDQFAAGGLLTTSEADKLKALGERTDPYTLSAFGVPSVSDHDVAHARSLS